MKKKNIINLNKKICLVTGCNGYIGKKIVDKLSRFGVSIIGTDIIIKKNKNLKVFIQANLESKKEIDLLIKNIHFIHSMFILKYQPENCFRKKEEEL